MALILQIQEAEINFLALLVTLLGKGKHTVLGRTHTTYSLSHSWVRSGGLIYLLTDLI